MSIARRRGWVIAGAAILLIAAGVSLLVVRLRSAETTRTAEVSRGRLEQTIETVGTVAAAEPMTITGAVGGRVVMVAVEPGDHVDAGDIVVQLDRAPYEEAVTTAQRALDAAELALTAAEIARTPDDAKSAVAVAAAAQQADTAATAVASAERDLGRTSIVSPVGGTVLDVKAVAGQPSSPGAPLVIVNPGDRLVVTADLDGTDVPRIPPGTAVTVVVDAFPGTELRGRVTRVAPQGESRGGGTVFPATVEVDGFEAIAARPGMTATVRVPALVAADALLVPAAAVESVGERSFVEVVRDGGTVRVEVTTGLRSGGLVEITSGNLREGDRVRLPAS